MRGPVFQYPSRVEPLVTTAAPPVTPYDPAGMDWYSDLPPQVFLARDDRWAGTFVVAPAGTAGRSHGSAADGRHFPFVPARLHQDKVQRQHDQGVAGMLNALGRRGELVQVGEKDFRLFNGSFSAGRDPAATDDADAGIDRGALWVNEVTNRGWLCVRNTPGGAVWKQITQ